MSLSERHSLRVMALRSLLCEIGPRRSSCPLAQASKYFPEGFVKGAKPLSFKIISGKPLSKAAFIMSFSPGDMAGETIIIARCKENAAVVVLAVGS